MEDLSVLATITSYNPDIELLKRNILSIKCQVDKIIVYENASVNRNEVIALCEDLGVDIVLNEKNEGVAGPLYNGIEYACENNYKYVLTLDQDSVSSNEMVKSLMQSMEADPMLAMCAARPILYGDDKESLSINSNDYVNFVITSGALSNAKIIREIGNYIPEMFIDWVDMEMCYRLRERGYKIMQSSAVIYHRMGDPIRKKIFGINCLVPNYSKERLFYIWRNAYYCFKRYKENKKLVKENKRTLYKLKIKILLFEKGRAEKLKAIKKGKKASENFYKKYSKREDIL